MSKQNARGTIYSFENKKLGRLNLVATDHCGDDKEFWSCFSLTRGLGNAHDVGSYMERYHSRTYEFDGVKLAEACVVGLGTDSDIAVIEAVKKVPLRDFGEVDGVRVDPNLRTAGVGTDDFRPGFGLGTDLLHGICHHLPYVGRDKICGVAFDDVVDFYKKFDVEFFPGKAKNPMFIASVFAPKLGIIGKFKREEKLSSFATKYLQSEL